MKTRSWCDSRLLALLVLGAAALCTGTAVAGPTIGVPAPSSLPLENWEARSLMTDTIFSPVREALAARTRVITQATGAANVRFTTEAQGGAAYFIFANGKGGSYPLDGAGTFIIKRSLADGSFLQLKIFTQDDPGTYVRLFPSGDRTVMDAWILGEPFQSSVTLPVSFDRLLTAPFSSIVEWSAREMSWPLQLTQAPGPGDERLERLVHTIVPRLRTLRDMDDGAMDGSGHMAYIATGRSAGRGGFNCSGFAKWIVDGLYAPIAGHPMDIGPLKSRNAGRDNPWSARFEEELDPFFGLDWSRGLARTVAQAQTGVLPTDEQVDVRDSDRLPYVRDVGYPVDRLAPLLYVLARRDPGTFYVGSINAPSALAVSEGTPTLRQHHHVIVLFPYVDSYGTFQIVVMERNLKTSILSLVRRYGSEYVHLERIGSEGAFTLPQIE